MRIANEELEIIDNDTIKVGCLTVTRKEINEVIGLMDTWKPKPEFKVGDYVRITFDETTEFGKWVFGRAGKIIEKRLSKTHVVEFAERIPDKWIPVSPVVNGIKEGHAWNFAECYLTLIE